MPQPVTPCLWFEGEAEEAVAFYVSAFPNSRVVGVSRFGERGPGPAGSAMAVSFELDGRPFLALNGGPRPGPFTAAVSLVAHCGTQAELDRVWDRLLEGGGEAQRCGWLTDRFGVAWQVVPSSLPAMMQSGDPSRTDRVMAALMPMVKLDEAALRAAFDGP